MPSCSAHVQSPARALILLHLRRLFPSGFPTGGCVTQNPRSGAPTQGPSPSSVPASPPLLELRNLSRVVEEGGQRRTLLSNLSQTFQEGELAIILGKSGSGKSTLLNLISGIDLPSGGEILLRGQRLDTLTEHQRTLVRRQQLGFVFQSFNLVPGLTVLENLLLPLELTGKVGSDERKRARTLLAEVGLQGRENAWPDRLSGGEQQRVAVARALIHQPALVLADEPTGNLDAETGQQVLALLDALTRKSGKTLIMVTHSLEAAGIADRRFTMREGHLVEEPAR